MEPGKFILKFIWEEKKCIKAFKKIMSKKTNRDLLYNTGKSAQCYVATWMEGEFGGELIHVYVWLHCSVVNLKLS